MKPAEVEDKDVIAWINKVLGEDNSGQTCHDLLKDGSRLCRIADKCLKKTSKFPHKMKQPFFCMENIEYFINCLKEQGIPDAYNFMTVDLFEAKDMRQVKLALSAFARAIYENDKQYGLLVGPAEAPTTKSVFDKF